MERIKVKISTFETKLMNNRKIRMLTTIDPLWNTYKCLLTNVLVKDQIIF